MLRYPYDPNDEPGKRVFEARLHQLVASCFYALPAEEQDRRGAGGMIVVLDGDDVCVELPPGETLVVISVADLLDSEPGEIGAVFVELPDDASGLVGGPGSDGAVA